jgi:CDP-2,3-bis-(O-geranylgeranyl)-sn-glycerol synthase
MIATPLLIGILLLLAVANGSPVLAARLLKHRFELPIDRGCKLRDGQALFGPAKTVRGLVVSICSTTVVALVLGFQWSVGSTVSVGAMAGDLCSSFLKRRLRMDIHAPCFGLDQIPEALFPLLLVQTRLGLSWWDIAVLLIAFVALQIGASRLLFILGIRDRPF